DDALSAPPPAPLRGVALALACALFLATVTLYAQMRELNQISTLRTPASGLAPAWHFLDTEQRARHEAILAARAGDPWGYRVLQAVVIEGVRRALPAIDLAWIFVGVRWCVNVALFAAAASYLASLGFGVAAVAAGLAALGWSVCLANYNAGLAFDTYAEVALYLAAASLLVRGRAGPVVLLAWLAAANRETALLMPLLIALAPAVVPTRRRLALGGIALAGQVAIVLALRMALGPQPLIVPEGYAPGLPLLGYNLLRLVTWLNLATTFLFVPVLALATWRRWPPVLRRSALLVPLWVVPHFVGAIVAETRLFLVPYALVVLPAALLALDPASASSPVPPR
ncbi:hypothetical protein K2Z84_09415, partial [Candidatus Binatia bacterium]|nr:hypothetical protein [Candidatus Binatia bacterium]